jgi:hypothetical protein
MNCESVFMWIFSYCCIFYYIFLQELSNVKTSEAVLIILTIINILYFAELTVLYRVFLK